MGPYSTEPVCREVDHFNPANLDTSVRPGDVVTLRSEGASSKGDKVVFEVKRLEVETYRERRFVHETYREYTTVYIVSRLGARHRIAPDAWTLLEVKHPFKPFPYEADAVISWRVPGSHYGDSAQRLGETDGWFVTGEARKFTSAELRTRIGDTPWKALS